MKTAIPLVNILSILGEIDVAVSGLKASTFCKPVIIAVFAALFSGASPAIASFDDQYVCETGDSSTEMIVTVSSMEPTKAKLQYRDNVANAASQIEMLSPPDMSGGEFRYQGGGFTLIGRNNHGILFDGDATLPCTRIAEPDGEEQAGSLLPYIILSGEGLAVHRPDTATGPMRVIFGPESSLQVLSRFLGSPGTRTTKRRMRCWTDGISQFRTANGKFARRPHGRMVAHARCPRS